MFVIIFLKNSNQGSLGETEPDFFEEDVKIEDLSFILEGEEEEVYGVKVVIKILYFPIDGQEAENKRSRKDFIKTLKKGVDGLYFS